MKGLCLGAGYEKLDTSVWLTIDLDPNTPVHFHMDVRDLSSILPDNEVDEIRAVDILEHLSYRDTVPALREWARVLKPGGRMFVQVPAADEMMRLWIKSMYDSDFATARWKLDQGLPDDLCSEPTPLMVRLAWRLLGGHFDGAYTRDSEHWYLNAHHALFDEETIRWAAEQAGLVVESIEVNPHPNYLVWAVKPT